MKSFENSIEKLIATVSLGIDFLYISKPSIKITDVKSYLLKNIEKPNAKRIIINSNSKVQIIENIRENFTNDCLSKKNKIECILQKAIIYLGDIVSIDAVNENWIVSFCNFIQEVNNVEIQDVLAKILANEVEVPGKTSIKSLNAICKLSKQELDLFKLACNIAFNSGRILKIDPKEKAFKEYGINDMEYDVLCSASLIYVNAILYTEHSHEKYEGKRLSYGNKTITCSKKSSCVYEFEQVLFTPTGYTLMNIIEIDKNYEYLKKFIEAKKKQNYIFS